MLLWGTILALSTATGVYLVRRTVANYFLREFAYVANNPDRNATYSFKSNPKSVGYCKQTSGTILLDPDIGFDPGITKEIGAEAESGS